jgi:hypothetical protein
MLLLTSVYCLLKKRLVLAHFTLLIPTLWKIIWIFFLTYGAAGNYDYYDTGFALVLLLLPYKKYFAQLTFVWFYFLAATIKVDDGWILGNYFKTLITGAPIFPEYFVPYFSNVVIFMQIVGSWFLLSNNKILQRAVFFYFLAFHIYSGFIVNYRYIGISIPALVILFGNLDLFKRETFQILKISKKTLIGYGFLGLMFLGQMIGILIPGDQKKTLEGNYWGLFMFEAAHQCKGYIKAHFANNNGEDKIAEYQTKSNIANHRCDPYVEFYKIKRNFCNVGNIKKVSWIFDHSVNGHPFERIVDSENICVEEYKTFSHNSWIKIGNQAEKIDKMVYRIGYIDGVDEEKYGYIAYPNQNEKLLLFLTNFYKYLWILTLLFVSSILLFHSVRKSK